MQSAGHKLRHAREAQGRAIEHVHAATRIPIKVLEAIEADEVSAISSAFLYRSFVRQIANCLALDYEVLKPDVDAQAARFPAPLRPGEGSHCPKVAALPVGRRKNSRLLLSVSAFAAVLIACSGLYAVWQKVKVVPAGINKAVVASGSVSNTDQANPSGFTLELSATEPAWLSIIADGKQSFDGILKRAETKILEGHRTARVRTANAGVVKVVFNGKSLGTLGPMGQDRTVLFTKTNYEILRAPARISEIRINRTGELTLLSALTKPPDF